MIDYIFYKKSNVDHIKASITGILNIDIQFTGYYRYDLMKFTTWQHKVT